MRTLAFVAVALLLNLASFGYAQEQDISMRRRAQQERLHEIERQAACEREAIEAQYVQAVTQQKAKSAQWLRQRVARLDPHIKVLLTEFAKMSHGGPYAYGYFDSASLTFPNSYGYFDSVSLTFPDSRKAVDLRNRLAEAYFHNAITEILVDGDFHKTLSDLADNPYVRAATREDARSLLDMMNRVKWGLDSLRKNRNARLHRLECWEQSRKDEVGRTIDFLDAAVETSQASVVSAVGSDGQGWFCMVEGVDGLLRTGDVINATRIKGATIAAISSQAVRFEKGGTSWEERL